MLEGNRVSRETAQLSPSLFRCCTSQFEATGYIFVIEDFSCLILQLYIEKGLLSFDSCPLTGEIVCSQSQPSAS